jgi:hypothetical protein
VGGGAEVKSLEGPVGIINGFNVVLLPIVILATDSHWFATLLAIVQLAACGVLIVQNLGGSDD